MSTEVGVSGVEVLDAEKKVEDIVIKVTKDYKFKKSSKINS